MNVLKKMRQGFEKLVDIMNIVACVLIAILCAWLLVDIFGRYFFHRPIPGTKELSGNVIVAVLFLGVSSVEKRREHIRSDILINKLSNRGGMIVEAVSIVFALVLLIMGFIYCFGDTMDSWRILEYDGEGSIHIPVYPFKTIITFGCGVMVVQLLLNLKDTLVAIAKNQEIIVAASTDQII